LPSADFSGNMPADYLKLFYLIIEECPIYDYKDKFVPGDSLAGAGQHRPFAVLQI